jgi:tartrate dehydratase alpha subunit/fumarate hydratase class I-like protein
MIAKEEGRQQDVPSRRRRRPNPASLVKYLTEKMKTLGTAACLPYHLAFVIGGTSASHLKAVKPPAKALDTS